MSLVRVFRAEVEAGPDCRPYTSGERPSSHLLDVIRRSDGACRRFLAARNDNPLAAARMLGATLRWRDEHGIDDILRTPHPEVAAAAKLVDEGYPHGLDDAGRPLMIHELARLDAARVLAQFSIEQCLCYVAHWMVWGKK